MGEEVVFRFKFAILLTIASLKQTETREIRDDPNTWMACLTLAKQLLLHIKSGIAHPSIQSLITDLIIPGIQVRKYSTNCNQHYV